MSKLPKPSRTLRSVLKETEDEQRRRRSSTAFSDSGISVTAPGQFEIDGDVTVTGTFTAEGKINNDALVAPVTVSVGHSDAAGFDVTTSWVTVASTTVVVPAGFTRAMVTAIASASAYNPTGSSDYLYASARIQADIDIGYSMPTTVEPGASRPTTQAATALLTGLSGSFNVWVKVKSQVGNWTTSTSGNVANIDATVTFLR